MLIGHIETQKVKTERWIAKMNAARRFASHYNQRMSVRAHRWAMPDGAIGWEYVIIPAGRQLRCFDGAGVSE